MKNTVSNGEAVERILPGNVASGFPILGSSFLGLAGTSGNSGDKAAAYVKGMFTLPKAAEAFTDGMKLFWNASESKLTRFKTEYFLGSCVGAYSASDEEANVNLGSYPDSVDPNITIVRSLSNLPDPDINGEIDITPMGNVIRISGEVDISPNRIVTSNPITVFLGYSTEVSKLISNVAGQALITSTGTVIAESVTFTASGAGSKAFGCASASGSDIITFKDVNFVGCTKVGTFDNYRNILRLLSADIACGDGMDISTSISSFVAQTNAIISPISGYRYVRAKANLTVNSRIRTALSNFDLPTGTAAFEIESGATLPAESFQLINNLFDGEGSPVIGLTRLDNEAYWKLNLGLSDTTVFAHIVMEDNATATVIGTQNEWVKIAGTTAIHKGNHISRFTHTNNRATYIGAKPRNTQNHAIVTLTGNANDVIAVGFAVNGQTADIGATKSKITLNAGGRAESVPVIAHATQISNGDYIEMFMKNESANRNATATALNILISEQD